MSKASHSEIAHISHELDRRGLLKTAAQGLAAGSMASMLAGVTAAQAAAEKPKRFVRYPGPRPQVGMLVYPRMVMLDLIGPMTVLNLLWCDLHLVWKEKVPVATDVRMPVMPTKTFDECPKDLDILFAPGGILGTTACMQDDAVLDFLADRGSRAKYVTSVCTGGLIMAAAGLYRGYRATAHWAVVDLLEILGATPVHDERVVVDRNRYSGGGVTAGIDFGLTIGAKLRDEEEARRAQLIIEYDPDPPFDAGSPRAAGEEFTKMVKSQRTGMDARAEAAAREAAKKFT